MGITIYPNLPINSSTGVNPYIRDFIEALQSRNLSIVNKPHKNPLISLLKPSYQGDVFIFNWLEDVRLQKYGFIQFIVAVIMLLFLKIRNKKIIWILHNKCSHLSRHHKSSLCLRWILSKASTLIITHSKDGIELIRSHYTAALSKSVYLNHPTKNRMDLCGTLQSKTYDIIIWGTITPYKGVIEFLRYIKEQNIQSLRICIIGKSSTAAIYNELMNCRTKNIEIINKAPSFEELAEYMAKSEFVLVPYHSESILSSGVLMDSLSFGAKIIGPDAGSFKDYSHEKNIKVYTFGKYGDIPNIITKYKGLNVSRDCYRTFLEENDWEHFINRLINRLDNIK